MNGVVTSELREPRGAAEVPTREDGSASLRRRAADFWLDAMFRSVRSAPWLPKVARPVVIRGTYRVSRAIRDVTAANARRIFGPDVSRARQRDYGRGVLANFYDFVCDVGRSLHLSREQLIGRIESVEGIDHYVAARALKKGAVIATAHMGSFEAGAAGLLDRERAMHVVFKRDATRFEQVRSAMRQRLGVIEAPVDEGWTIWLKLREALLRDEVVMVQADRVMPGQKGATVPFLHGHLMLPTGPVKLALASGAPIVPIFAIRSTDGRIRIHIEPHIDVTPSEQDPHPALLSFAGVLEQYVRAYPQQWLCLHRAFCEDQS